LVAPWWSRHRDEDLRDLWPSNDYLSGTVYTLVSKLTALPFKIAPLDNTIISHVRLAEELEYDIIANSEMGQGWIVAFSKWLIDLFCQDNGSFFEIYGPGRPSGPIKGAPLGIAHLDASKCSRTGSPEFPVVYQDTDGKKYKMHRTRVMFASSLPSPIAEMHGVGLSAISRCLMIARNLSDMLTYESEMYGSRPINRIIVGKGITGRSIMEAFSTAEEQMNAEGLTRFAKSVAIGSTRTDIDLNVIPLSTAPIGYDRRSNTDLALYTLALAFGVDARELWPATSSGATKADALVQAMKARGKGPGQIIQTVETLFNSMFLPPYLKFNFDLQDDEEDQLRAAVQGTRATRHAADLGAGSISVRVVREQMMEDGDLSLAQFRELELGDGRLEDGSDVVTLFYSPEQAIRSLLALEGFDDVFSIDDPAVAVETIGRKALEVQERMMQAKPTARFHFKSALAALSALRDIYVQREKEAEAAKGVASREEMARAGTPQAEPKQEAPEPGEAEQAAATPQTPQGSPGTSSIEGVSHVEREMKAAAGVKSWAGAVLLDGLKARMGRKPAEVDEVELDEVDVEAAIKEWNENMPKMARGILEAEEG
jgi:hypothetical protein